MLSQNKGFGRPIRDLAIENLSADRITGRIITALELEDANIIEIERDIFELQDSVSANTKDIISNATDIANLENTVSGVVLLQSVPWFNKSITQYESSLDWDVSTLPSDPNAMFTRRLQLTRTYTSAFVVLPLTTNSVGNSREVSLSTENDRLTIFITTNPLDATRLKSFEMEYVPLSDRGSDVLVGHGTLLARTSQLNGVIVGSDRQQSTSGNCMAFAGTGEWYIQAMYLDNTNGLSELVMVGQKYGTTTLTPLSSIEVYGFQ